MTSNPEIKAIIAELDQLRADYTALSSRYSEMGEQRDNFKGAMDAQDQREREAGAKCGVPYEEHGCDWPDAVADRVLALTAEVELWKRKATERTELLVKAEEELEALKKKQWSERLNFEGQITSLKADLEIQKDYIEKLKKAPRSWKGAGIGSP